MRVRMRKYGGSLAIRIPDAFAIELGLTENSLVEPEMIEGQVVIRLVPRPTFTLESHRRICMANGIPGRESARKDGERSATAKVAGPPFGTVTIKPGSAYSPRNFLK